MNTIIGIGGFHWIAYVSSHFGQLPYPVAVIILLLYCLIANPQLYVFFIAGRFIKNENKFFQILFWPTAFAAAEFIVRPIKIFPENFGNILIHWLPVAQLASIGGVAILSFMCFFAGSAIYFSLQSKKVATAAIPLLVLLFSSAVLYGNNAIRTIEKQQTDSLNVSIIQANIGDLEKIVSETGNLNAISYVVRKYIKLTTSAPKTELLIWPETAYPIAFQTKTANARSDLALEYAAMVLETANRLHTPMLIGGYEHENRNDYNSAILINATGEVESSYKKNNLLIFGEYMPFSNFFPSLKKINPQMGDFGKGPGPIPLIFSRTGKKQISLGINICYEALMPEYMRQLHANGADIFVNLTNDSWFGDSFEPHQHLQLAQLRTIENRIPMIRATNTGISTFITATGMALSKSKLFESEILQSELPFSLTNQAKSLYSRFGEWFAYLCVAITGFVLLFRAKDLLKKGR